MTTPRSEQETIISYDRETEEWHYYSDVPKHNRKWRDLVSPSHMQTSDNGDVTLLEGIIHGSVSIRKPVVMSEENKAKMAARLKKYRRVANEQQ